MKYVIILMLGLILGNPLYAEEKERVVIDQRVVEFDERIFRGVNGAFSTINQIREEKLEGENYELRQTIQKLRAQVDLLMKMWESKPQEPVEPEVVEPVKPIEPEIDPDLVEPVEPIEPEVVEPEPVNPTDHIDTSNYEVTELDVRAFRVFQNSCARCHNEEKQSGGLKLVNQATQSLVLHPLRDRVRIWAAITGKGKDMGIPQMPYGKPIEEKDKDVIRKWMIEEAIRLRDEQ